MLVLSRMRSQEMIQRGVTTHIVFLVSRHHHWLAAELAVDDESIGQPLVRKLG